MNVELSLLKNSLILLLKYCYQNVLFFGGLKSLFLILYSLTVLLKYCYQNVLFFGGLKCPPKNNTFCPSTKHERKSIAVED